MNTDLNILARTLAEQLRGSFRFARSHISTQVDLEELFTQQAEAVIREAIEKTLEIAASTVGTAKSSHGCDDFIIRNDAEDAIRSLKQSNSGMEVRK